MKKQLLFVSVILLFAFSVKAENYTFSNNWGKQGFNLVQSKSDAIQVVYSIQEFSVENVQINGQTMQKVSLPGIFLFNDAGMPDLPGSGRYIAIPQGSVPHLKITASEVEVYKNLDISPAPVIPLDTQKDILFQKNQQVYGTDAFYPASPVRISGVDQIRGTDVVILGVTPFQYNPVTKELMVYKNLRIELSFEGGSGKFGNDAFRSPYMDGLMADNILNFSSLPALDYTTRMRELRNSRLPGDNECEYIIICPNGTDFVAWADSLKNFRNQQGILTRVFTLADVGGNTDSQIKNFISNAYNNWSIKPVACLLLGDYGTDASKNIISHIYPHPGGYPSFASDNYFADVTGDEMPDVVFSRIAANDNTQLTAMVGRILNFERSRPTDTGYYAHPISALGWQDERWFQLCSEITGGFLKYKRNKHVVRINAVYSGNGYSAGFWSTAVNTSTIVNYFGPSGLAYIPSNPATLGGFTGGNYQQINNAINSGAFMLLHRDHGAYTLWGEPAYNIGNISQLNNTLLPFVFSINCETGAYHQPSGCPNPCFSEAFQRLTKNGHDAGALGLVCPSETSYSFVNDAFVWGMFDNMWPAFMPAYSSQVTPRGILPAFGAAAGKYFLKQSSWPYNPGDKQVTYRLFHMHGDAFLTLADTVPLNLTVNHDANVPYGNTSVQVQATDSSFIALTVAGEIIATAYGDGSVPVNITIPVLPVGTQIMIVVTKQNYNRYTDYIPVISQTLTAEFIASSTSICEGNAVNFTDQSVGGAESWSWTFQGATPSSSTDQNPANISYPSPGVYDVTLTVSKTGVESNTMTKTGYIHVYQTPSAAFTSDSACAGAPVSFTDQSNIHGSSVISRLWNFGDPASGAGDTSTVQNPFHTFNTAGTYSVSFTLVTSGGCIDSLRKDVMIYSRPDQPGIPQGETGICSGSTGNSYTVGAVTNALSYEWVVSPPTAGTISGSGITANFDVSGTFTGTALIKVRAVNSCSAGDYSEELSVNVIMVPAQASKPSGPDSVNTNRVLTSEFTTNAVPNATSYNWSLSPSAAGSISGGETATANWISHYNGPVSVSVKAINSCGSGISSEDKPVILYSPSGIQENNFGFDIYPNPSGGYLTLNVNATKAPKLILSVYNTIGVKVYAETFTQNGKDFNRTIDLSFLQDGVYYLKVENYNSSLIRKLVIRK